MEQNDGKLVRALGLFALVAFGVGDILGAGVYALTGRITDSVGTAAWSSYAVAGIVAALTGLTYAEYVSRYPKAGGAAHFVASTFRVPFLTFLVIFFVVLSGLFSVATSARTLAVYAGPLWSQMPMVFQSYVVPLCYLVVLGYVVARGIVFSSIANIICAVVEVSALVFIIAVAVPFFWGADFTQINEAPENLVIPGSVGLVLNGAALAFFAFIGFEDMANMAEEVKDPERTVPRALCISIAITSAIYCLIALAVASVLTPDEFGNPRAPVEVVARAAPWFPIALFAVIPAFAVFNTGIVNMIMASRLLYGMSHGEHRQLPAVLARVHPTWRTPVIALLVSMAVVVVLVLLSGQRFDKTKEPLLNIGDLAGGTTSFLLIVFALLHIGLTKVKLSSASEKIPPFRIPLIVPILGAVTCIVLMFSRSPKDYLIAGIMTTVAVALFFVNWFILKRRIVDPVD